MEKTPLEVLAAGTRANARQRAEAARQIPLWLVARACWKQKNAADFQVVAQKLATRALEAARRQSENSALMAMLREQGEFALARGDRAGAEAAWGEMLKLVVEPADRSVKKPEREAKETGRDARRRSPRGDLDGSRPTSVRLASYQAQQPSPPRRDRTRPAADQGGWSPEPVERRRRDRTCRS